MTAKQAPPRELHPIADAVPFPEALRQAEWPPDRAAARVGVGLSGGGIRSATFSLGFFQGLAQWRLLRHIDYLSTVSGGGYFGAFYGHMLHRLVGDPQTPGQPGAPNPRVTEAERELTNPASRPLRFLRDNGRYLSPNGAGDLLLGAAIAIRSLVAVLIVMGSLALLVVTLVVLGRLSLPALDLLSHLPKTASWISPLFWAPLLAVALLVVPVGWAYWLVPPVGRTKKFREVASQWAAPVAAVGTALIVMASPFGGQVAQGALKVLGAITGLTIGRYLLAVWTSRTASQEPEGRAALMRGSLSRGLTRALVVVGALTALAVVDSLGMWIASVVRRHGETTLSIYGVLGALATWLRRRVANLSDSLGARRRPALPTHLLINVGAVVLVVALLGGLAAIPNLLSRSQPQLLILAGALTGIVIASGGVWSFVNRSSLHALYEARLRRAYLGATNPARYDEGENHPPITDPHRDDGLPMAEYNPARHGGPVHLINVTVNETVDGRSQVQQRDRKGVGMAIGPGGVSVSRTHHAKWAALVPRPSLVQRLGAKLFGHKAPQEAVSAGQSTAKAAAASDSKVFRVFAAPSTPEDLDVGQWVAISGAAFSTGLGSRTSLGLSLLAGLLNVRLGYWWHSGVDPEERAGRPRMTGVKQILARFRQSAPVQGALLDEWLAHFPGVARREWYLSDGGHFENLGGYELIRRRLPFIILVDNEADVDYEFQGLGNLVRKARVDFDTEITFLSERDLTKVFGQPLASGEVPDWRSWVGPITSLRRGARAPGVLIDPVFRRTLDPTDASRSTCSMAHAALARIRYPTRPGSSEPDGWLLYVKPTLVGDETPDITHYHHEHPDFPHESTADQFFDEAQWESYRKLGEVIAMKLFDSQSRRDNSLHQMLRGEATPEVDASIARPAGSADWVPLEPQGSRQGGDPGSSSGLNL